MYLGIFTSKHFTHSALLPQMLRYYAYKFVSAITDPKVHITLQ